MKEDKNIKDKIVHRSKSNVDREIIKTLIQKKTVWSQLNSQMSNYTVKTSLKIKIKTKIFM